MDSPLDLVVSADLVHSGRHFGNCDSAWRWMIGRIVDYFSDEHLAKSLLVRFVAAMDTNSEFDGTRTSGCCRHLPGTTQKIHRS